MFSKFVLTCIIVSSVCAQTPPSADNYALNVLIPYLNATKFLFDGPDSIAYAPTTPMTNTKPTVEELKYYNYYSAAMYCQYEIVNNLSCHFCQHFKNDVDMNIVKVLWNNNTDTMALFTVSHNRQEIVTTFRGSQNAENLVLDFTFFSVCQSSTNCNVKLHVGFYVTTMSIYKEVIKQMGYLASLYPTYKLVLAGHSLGGVMARITTYFILSLNQFPGKNIELYTYGEPRSGNKAFVDYMNAQHITTARVTARADLAPHYVPVSIAGTSLLGDHYYHAQPEYWIDGDDNQKWANLSTYADPTCSDSMGPAYSLPDHFLYFDANYLVCWLNQPFIWLTMPASILNPVGTIPPLPTFISDFLGSTINFLSSDLLGGLGR